MSLAGWLIGGTSGGSGWGSSGGGSAGGGGSFSFGPAPSSGGGGWFASAPAPSPTYASPTSVSFYSSAPAPAGYSLASAPNYGYSVGPYGEGIYTPIDYPAMRFLEGAELPGDALRRRRGQTNGGALCAIALGVALLALLKK